MQVFDKKLTEIARRHGVDLVHVVPPNKSERLENLAKILKRTDVPFPIPQAVGDDYYRQAASGQLFGVGTLSGKTVDLKRYANFQQYDEYSIEEHLSWACLVADQQATKHQYACREYLQGESTFQIGGAVIPEYYALNARIYQQTGWQLATVSEIIPAEVFFACHSSKFFPVTTFMRALEQDYLQEPDIGHDVAGHVATFTIPAVAEVMNNHGLARDVIERQKHQRIAKSKSDAEVELLETEAQELLLFAGRLYWFTVEFGLVMQDGELRAFGAGILSSPGETKYSIDSPESNRVLIDPSDDQDLLRLACTDYLISEYQKTYFVMKSFELLRSLTPERILNITRAARSLPHYTWREIVPGDDVINVGTIMTSPNEKYYRLMADQPLDDCLRRTAIRNLRLLYDSTDQPLPDNPSSLAFKIPPPPVPESVQEWFKRCSKTEYLDQYDQAAGKPAEPAAGGIDL